MKITTAKELMENSSVNIAIFMGFTYEKNIGWYDNETCMPQIIYDQQNGNCFDELLFDKSWDWLIPVIDKIYSSKEYFKYKDTLGQFNNGLEINTKFINVTVEAIMDYINWYNQQK